MELTKIEKILKKIPPIAEESHKYWKGEAGDYHRAYLLQWYRESMELLGEIRKEIDYVK